MASIIPNHPLVRFRSKYGLGLFQQILWEHLSCLIRDIGHGILNGINVDKKEWVCYTVKWVGCREKTEHCHPSKVLRNIPNSFTSGVPMIVSPELTLPLQQEFCSHQTQGQSWLLELSALGGPGVLNVPGLSESLGRGFYLQGLLQACTE